MRKYDMTKKGVITKIYGHQLERSLNKKKIYVMYSKKELSNWVMEQTLFHTLFDKWISGGCQKEMKPSVDRIDDSLGYFFGNIQIMTFKENKDKGHRACREAKISSGKPHRRVVQLTKNGELCGDFISINEASRVTGIGVGNISSCVNVNKKQKTAGGYVWRYYE